MQSNSANKRGHLFNKATFSFQKGGPRVAHWVRSLNLTTHTSLSPIRHGFAPSFVNYKKGCTRLATASDKVYQLLARGRWFSPRTSASSTTKTGRHDIAEILLKVALNTKIQIQIPFKRGGIIKGGTILQSFDFPIDKWLIDWLIGV